MHFMEMFIWYFIQQYTCNIKLQNIVSSNQELRFIHLYFAIATFLTYQLLLLEMILHYHKKMLNGHNQVNHFLIFMNLNYRYQK